MKSRIIGGMYRSILKPILFLFHPETMHNTFGRVGKKLGAWRRSKNIIRRVFNYKNTSLHQKICGIEFNNPVGLAAGFDKDISLPNIIGDVGFGWEECGSITYQAYEGNPGTRLHRLKKSHGLIVNYGLKNHGAEYAKKTLQEVHCEVPLFVSIAKTNCTQTCDFQTGINDYQSSIRLLHPLKNIAGFVLNISCPNSFGGEDYTSSERLGNLLSAIRQISVDQPIFVKMPVDKSRDDLQHMIQTCIDYQIQGVIISNLIKDRKNIVEKDDIMDLPGGISGKPTQGLSDNLIGLAYQKFGNQIIIIGVGGIFSAKDAYHKIKQGASLVQLITGMIFEGPQLIGEINHGIVELMKQDGFTYISQAIGANFR